MRFAPARTCIVVGFGLFFGSLFLSATKETVRVQFADVTAAAGIRFRHTNAASGSKYLIETMGPGCAFVDFDNDGFLDIYLVNGAALPGFTPQGPIRAALYRNNRNGTFTDVTRSAGVGAEGLYGMGVAAADYDNDGYADLYVTGFGRSILYHNNGDGTFSDATQRAGVANAGEWATSAAFFDYDRDGKLDLYVTNYLDYRLAGNTYCGSPQQRSYCHPDEYPPVPGVLYHNNGDGTFRDVSKSSGIGGRPGKGLGVVAADFNGDGYSDLYVANDAFPNFLWINNRKGGFSEVAELAGAAYSGEGKTQSGMGVAAGDFDGDGQPDILVTNLSNEGYALYRNEGNLFFSDISFPVGVGRVSLLYTGWGVAFFDYDNDGDADIFGLNGHVMDNIEKLSPMLRYLQPALLLENRNGRFTDVTGLHGEALLVPRAGRGAAVGDFDNDGNLDILTTSCNGPAALLRNDGGAKNHWLTLECVGRRSNRDAIGARVTLTSGGQKQVQQIVGGGSYLSTNDRRLHFGLGPNTVAENLEIEWPSGRSQILRGVAADRILRVMEGE